MGFLLKCFEVFIYERIIKFSVVNTVWKSRGLLGFATVPNLAHVMEGQWLGKGFGVGVGEQYRTSGMLQHRITSYRIWRLVHSYDHTVPAVTIVD